MDTTGKVEKPTVSTASGRGPQTASSTDKNGADLFGESGRCRDLLCISTLYLLVGVSLDLAAVYGGTSCLETSPKGGLRARLQLPAA